MATENNKVDIDINVDPSKYDDCNSLVLDASKPAVAKTEKKEKRKVKQPVLSKKKRKKLEKVLERKNRKINRAKLISDLQQYQVDDSNYDRMPSTSVVQTAGRKRIYDLLNLYNSFNNKNEGEKEEEFVYKRVKIPKIKLKNNEKNFYRKDQNVVGLEISSSSDESSGESEEVEENEDDTDQTTQEVERSEEVQENAVVDESVKSSDATQAIQCSDQITDQSVSSAKDTKCQEKKPVKKSVFVVVNRSSEVQKARLKLPILPEEHIIMEAIMYNPVVIICGETGSGKTTQVPQFLYEAGYTLQGKMIGVTEPRRVAAISMSKRVGYELNLPPEEVSYQVRFEGNAGDKTKIKFMTDGILMKEIEQDILLRKYSALIIDEAHERSLYSDILIGFLSRVVQTRHKQGDPLKLIIMSATLRVEDFTKNSRLFKDPPPVIKVESRQYKVDLHFKKETNPNYMQDAFAKVCSIHSKMPPGGILVFVTGRKEVRQLCAMLTEKFPFKKKPFKKTIEKVEQDTQLEDKNDAEKSNEKPDPITVNLDLFSVNPVASEGLNYLDNESNESSDEEEEDRGDKEDENEDDETLVDDIEVVTHEPLYCLPLYSMLPNHKQALVFKEPPSGCRLCVIATNVAETSLTIPNIKYVVDTGKIKRKVYDHVTGISTFLIDWTSKASADQRAGRAGRTSAGHCYRLYSSAVFADQFKQYSDPEIVVKPVDDLLLQMKAIGIDNVVNFPFPTQPNVEALLAAEKRLLWLDALKEEIFYDRKNHKITRSKITDLGKIMSFFPVNPRYSKMLCLSNQSDLIPYTVAIISALTVQEVFLINESDKKKNDFFRNPNCLILGDIMALLSAIGAANFEGLSAKFCDHYSLRYNAMVEINKLRSQLTSQVKQITKNLELSLELSVPSDRQVKQLRQLFLCGFGDHVAKRIPVTTVTEQAEDGGIRKKEKPIRNCYQSIEVEDPVFISPNSTLFNETPQYVAYQEIFESSRMCMRNLVVIEPEWLPIYASKHCNFSNPLEQPPPRYDPRDDMVKCHRKSTFGPYNWELPAVEVEYPDGTDKYRYFAYFLFNGDVLKWFAKHTKLMSTPPIILTKTWSFAQPKVEKVMKCLTTNEILSKKALLAKWKSDKKFLLNEYLEWIHESQRELIRTLWPPVA